MSGEDWAIFGHCCSNPFERRQFPFAFPILVSMEGRRMVNEGRIALGVIMVEY